MNGKALFEIEATATMVKGDIKTARFMANLINCDFFTYERERKTFALRYDVLKAMFDIMFDYVIAADNRMNEMQKYISAAFSER